jgi:hypothetical protein
MGAQDDNPGLLLKLTPLFQGRPAFTIRVTHGAISPMLSTTPIR